MASEMKNAYKTTSLSSFLGFLRINRYTEEDLLLQKNLKGIVGFKPKKIDLYKIALIHRSASFQNEGGQTINNERLEYLGDAVLDAIIADYLYHMYPLESEGFLTQVRARIVNGEKLSEIASGIGLNHLVISNSIRPQAKKNLYGDAFEALIGAIYLDRGYRFTAKFIVSKVLRKYINIPDLIATDTNYKSQLIEWAQREKKEVRFSTEESESNSKSFVSFVLIEEERMGKGEGSSKKNAEQEAARLTLTKLGAD